MSEDLDKGAAAINEIMNRGAPAAPPGEGNPEAPAVIPPMLSKDFREPVEKGPSLEDTADRISSATHTAQVKEERQAAEAQQAEAAEPELIGIDRALRERDYENASAEDMLQRAARKYDAEFKAVQWARMKAEAPEMHREVRKAFLDRKKELDEEAVRITGLRQMQSADIAQYQQAMQVKAAVVAKEQEFLRGRKEYRDAAKLRPLLDFAFSEGWSKKALAEEPVETWYEIDDRYKAIKARTAKMPRKAKPVDERPSWQKRAEAQMAQENVRDRQGIRATEIKLRVMGASMPKVPSDGNPFARFARR